MCEDKIIKNLNNFVAFAQKEENFTYYSEYKFDNELADFVQGLLDLYQKEKEKNKEIEIGLQEEINKVREMKTRLFGNSISKDKIRELLKVIQKEKDIATKNILEKDYNLVENGAICQELGYIEGELKKLLED